MCVRRHRLILVFKLGLLGFAAMVYQKSGGKMITKNRNNKGFDTNRTLSFGIVLILSSLFGLFLASSFGVAPTSPLVLILIFGVAYGLILVMISILSVIITITEYQPQKKKVMKK